MEQGSSFFSYEATRHGNQDPLTLHANTSVGASATSAYRFVCLGLAWMSRGDWQLRLAEHQTYQTQRLLGEDVGSVKRPLTALEDHILLHNDIGVRKRHRQNGQLCGVVSTVA